MDRSLKFTLAGVLTATCLTASVPAFAADIMEPVEAPIANWTGFHIGAGGGYGAVLHEGDAFFDAELSNDDDTDDFFLGLDLDDLGDRGAIATVEGGFDFQLSENFVLGILGDFTWTNFESDARATQCVDIDCSLLNINVELDNMWTIAGRLGFLSSPSTLWYGLVGWTHSNVDVSLAQDSFIDGEDPGDPDYDSNNSDSIDGLTVGVGVETLFTDHISGKLEYRYTDLDAISDVDTLLDDPPEFVDLGHDFDTTVQTIRAVVSFRFGMFQ
jgi:outer membrane immunogenic protein